MRNQFLLTMLKTGLQRPKSVEEPSEPSQAPRSCENQAAQFHVAQQFLNQLRSASSSQALSLARETVEIVGLRTLVLTVTTMHSVEQFVLRARQPCV